jgi:exonuclease SbcC
LISSVKSEAVAEQIKAITGLDRELFREIVWMRQEHLKELLDTTPRERQKRLDELFGLSDYETAWSNIQAYQKEYEVERRLHEKDPDIAGIGKLTSEYNETVEEFSTVEIGLQDATRNLALTRRTLDDADSKLQKLEEVRNVFEKFKRKEAELRANLSNVENLRAALTEKIEKKKESIEDFNQRLTAMEAQTESHRAKLREIGLSPDQPPEAMRQYLAALDDQISKIRGQQEAAIRGIQEDQRRISSTSTENRCPLCLQPLTEEYKNGLVHRIQEENSQRQKTVSQLQHEIEELQQMRKKANDTFSDAQALAPRIEDLRSRVDDESRTLADLSRELDEKLALETEIETKLKEALAEVGEFDMSELESAKARREEASNKFFEAQSELRIKENRKKELARRLDEMKDRIDQAQQKIERMEKTVKIIEIISSIRDGYRSIQPRLRSEFVKVLRSFVQQVLDSLVSGEGPLLSVVIDESYTPYVTSESGVEREVSNLSGGERTLLAFAYRLGLGQLIMQSRTGHGLSMLLLDEPTESLGREDGSIDRLAEAISRFKAIEQIIAVTHSEAFAEKAEHVIRLEKEAGISKVSIER